MSMAAKRYAEKARLQAMTHDELREEMAKTITNTMLPLIKMVIEHKVNQCLEAIFEKHDLCLKSRETVK